MMLHYTVMGNIWKMIYETAKKLNVQVFATTHSWDCVRALSVICDANEDEENKVTMQRISKTNPNAVNFSAAEIIHIAADGVEVR